MIPVKVQKISYYHPSRSYAVILKELDGDRRLPVLIGAFEAKSIAMAMEYMETPRPLTHDLITNLIKGIDANLSSVKLTKLEEGVFYSVLDIQSKEIGHYEIDSRPSDALAIALRMHSPIFVSDEIMKDAITFELFNKFICFIQFSRPNIYIFYISYQSKCLKLHSCLNTSANYCYC